MSLRSPKAIAFALLPALGMTFCLAGCSLTSTTPTGEIERKLTAGVCKAWLPVTYSSQDTPETQMEARANNAARKAYCE